MLHGGLEYAHKLFDKYSISELSYNQQRRGLLVRIEDFHQLFDKRLKPKVLLNTTTIELEHKVLSGPCSHYSPFSLRFKEKSLVHQRHSPSFEEVVFLWSIHDEYLKE